MKFTPLLIGLSSFNIAIAQTDMVATRVDAPTEVIKGESYDYIGGGYITSNKGAEYNSTNKLYLSQDSVFNKGTDILLNSDTYSVSGNGSSGTGTFYYFDTVIPKTLTWPDGKVYFIIEIDSDNLISETIETNNIAISNSVPYYQNALSIEDESFANFQISPNPAIDQLKISNIGNADLTLLNNEGSIVINTKTNYETTIDVSHLPKGIYFLKIQKDSENLTKKIIKN